MKHVKTLTNKTLKNTMAKGGCGECQTSCQSACKTSCTVGNQSCENNKQFFDCLLNLKQTIEFGQRLFFRCLSNV